MSRSLLPLALSAVTFAGGALLQCAPETRMSDAVATQTGLQVQDCEDIVLLLQVDAGGNADLAQRLAQARADARVCVCGARYALIQAGSPQSDAGRHGCPQ